MKELEEEIFNINSKSDFESAALKVFAFQSENCAVYREWCRLVKRDTGNVRNSDDIPFLPITLFREKPVICGSEKDVDTVFCSSATTGSVPSRHYVKDVAIYERSIKKGFELFYGDPSAYVILALLPGYLERKDSSLVFMTDKLMKMGADPLSGFFLNDHEELCNRLLLAEKDRKKVLLIGVSYALLDLCGKTRLGSNVILMETGGMKGKREELSKETLHARLTEGLGVASVHSEYGMTELLSQAYSRGGGKFQCPPWMKVHMRDVYDPFSAVAEGKTGGINVTDLANLHSCSFIATQDLGRMNGNSFELMGRYDAADIRGCNLMLGEA